MPSPAASTTDVAAAKPTADAPPPTYDTATGQPQSSSSQNAASSAGATSSSSAGAGVGGSSSSQNNARQSGSGGNGDGGDTRPLPPGWVKQYDQNHGHNFWVDTSSKPPRSIWTHPLDDAAFLKANPQYAPADSSGSSSSAGAGKGGPSKSAGGFAPPPTAPPPLQPNGGAAMPGQGSLDDRITAAGNRAAQKARDKPPVTGMKKLRRNMKDKSTGMDHVERARHKAEHKEMETISAEQRRATARAFLLAAQTGQPQFLGQEARTGGEYWAEPPAPGMSPHLLSSFPPPYGFESRRDGPRTFVRAAAPGYRSGYGAYGGGMGASPMLGLGAGMLGGAMLGGLLF